ncbi:MAG: ribbon-helix-helix protein, CopG family [Deltaproteobacteria bacterium]|nr:ribbon-helix-helix protein, CopG family [Deltaproteobacteria bacterium]
MKTLPITARLNQDTVEKLEKLSGATKRSKSFLVSEAVSRYLKEEEWQILAIEEGLKQAEKGRFASDEEVTQFFKDRGDIEN